MENKITLLILAAGIGSRYGSLKQVDKIGPGNETITDYSVFDAYRAGFDKVVFVIRKNIESDFKEVFQRIGKYIDIDYVFQENDALPKGVQYNSERIKPWGTGHAVLVAQNKITTPFAVVNADDFYGAQSYKVLADFLKRTDIPDEEKYCMVGFQLKKTLSEFGHVSRGICEIDAQGFLKSIVERTKIQYLEDNGSKKIVYFDETDSNSANSNNQTPNYHVLSGDEIVSMNFWGFPPSVFQHLNEKFEKFITANAFDLKAEFYLPFAINELINENKARVKVLKSSDDWFGVTYKEDKQVTIQRIRQLIEKGLYPQYLWQ
jgi:choline kinase